MGTFLRSLDTSLIIQLTSTPSGRTIPPNRPSEEQFQSFGTATPPEAIRYSPWPYSNFPIRPCS